MSRKGREGLLTILSLFFAISSAFAVSEGRILDHSQSHTTFIINHGSNDNILVHDEADFYLGTKQKHLRKLGRAKVTKIFPTYSTWMLKQPDLISKDLITKGALVLFFSYHRYDPHYFKKEYIPANKIVLPYHSNYQMAELYDRNGNDQPNKLVKNPERHPASAALNLVSKKILATVPATGLAKWEEKSIIEIDENDQWGTRGSDVIVNELFPVPDNSEKQKHFRFKRIQSKIDNHVENANHNEGNR
ncbi:MAG: hypothetical protein HQK52_02065 [Oligoflexia bacterium]|nr:hypothetical protein [Oligoflexia bacterium]